MPLDMKIHQTSNFYYKINIEMLQKCYTCDIKYAMYVYDHLPCQILQDSMFKATRISILLSAQFITLSQKRPSLTKPFVMEIVDSEIINLLDTFTIL